MIPFFFFLQTLPEAQRTQSIESVTWADLSTKMISYFSLAKWFKLQTQYSFIWFQLDRDGNLCMSCKFGNQVVLLALIANLVTKRDLDNTHQKLKLKFEWKTKSGNWNLGRVELDSSGFGQFLPLHLFQSHHLPTSLWKQISIYSIWLWKYISI